MAQLEGKVVLVTGAAGVIGKALVTAIEQAGGTAVGTVFSGADTHLTLDVTSEAGWERIVAHVERTYGHLDGLANAAGVLEIGSIENTDYAAWQRVVSVNLGGTFLGCKYAFPLLRKRGGSIVNFSSVFGLVGNTHLAAYSASKGGVCLLSKSVALHGARCRPPVRCNAVCPAFIDGSMVEEFVRSTPYADIVRRKLAADIPLGRLGRPEETAALSIFLLSDAAAFITGADLPVDGAMTAR